MAVGGDNRGIKVWQCLRLDRQAHRTLQQVSGQVGKRSSLFATEAFEIHIGGVRNRNRDSLGLTKSLGLAVVVCHW